MESENNSLYFDNKEKYKELLSYKIIVENQIFYSRRHDYISLIKKYRTNEIDSLLLRFEFFQMEREDRKIKKDLEKKFQ